MDENEYEPRTSLRRSSRLPWILLALAVVAGGLGLWFGMRPSPPPPPPPVAEAPAPPPAAPEPTPEAATAGEAKLPDLLPGISPDALVRRGLAFDDLLRRTAVVIDNLAEGVSPRRELAFLAPKGGFKAAARGGGLFIDPASYARYDAFAAAVTSVDARALGAAWRVARPALQAAYRTLGYPGPALDLALGRALRRIAAAPVRDRPVAIRDEDGVFVFADEALEMLPEVEKHLLRMGPANTRALQAKARALLAELQLPEK
jgi:hypothetical protein